MKVVITGAGGFIGGNLCDYFNQMGHSVIGWDLMSKHADYLHIVVDMLNQTNLYLQLLKDKPELIIHCAGAAEVNKSFEKPHVDYESNVTVTHNLLFALIKAGLLSTRVIFISSAAVYGNPEKLPIQEDDKLNPLSPYALHKVMCEDILMYMHHNYDLDIKILRVFSAYGECLRKQIFWDMYTKAKETGRLDMFGTGYESRDFIYISDLVKAIHIVAFNAVKSELVYNVANGEERTIKEATEYFADAFGLSNKYISFSGIKREGNPINWRADISKLKSLGYSMSIDLREGIMNYVKWAENPDETIKLV